MEQITMVQVENLHPHEKNPRIDAASVADLVESIREHGIEVPLVAAPQPVGDGHVVLAGHRRLTAALQVGLTEVPVQIRADLTDAGEQLAFMGTENLHRDQLTVLEESRLVQDMLDLGMTQAQVAKQIAIGKQRVSERVKLAKLTDDTGDKVHRGQITVDDALVIAEYSDDPDTAADLEQWAGTPRFDYAVSEARRRREDQQRIKDAKKQIKKDGYRLADSLVRLEELVLEGVWATPAIEEAAGTHEDNDEWTDLLRAEHASCPGHSAVVLTETKWLRGTGQARAGTIIVGCDQQETLHPVPNTSDQGEQPEAEKDPWEELSAEEFATAKIHRERHLAAGIRGLDVVAEARDYAVRDALKMGWSDYVNDDEGIELLEALTGAQGKTKVARALADFPLEVLVWIGENRYDLSRSHRFMAQGRPGSSYWSETSKLRQLLERTGYEWTEVEQQAILLATGKPHDATADTTAADGAEDGDAA